MPQTHAAPWTAPLRALWDRIERHDFEPDLPQNFTARLARDQGWSPDFARAAVGEYRRFCFLAVAASHPVTPSEEVDEVWHSHLTYSRDYWNIWCGQVLGMALHHDPTTGGPVEQARFREQYAATLICYETFFGPPEVLFWPASYQRFRASPRFRKVDADRWFLLPRPAALWQRISQRARTRHRWTHSVGRPGHS